MMSSSRFCRAAFGLLSCLVTATATARAEQDPAPMPVVPANARTVALRPYADPWPAGRERWRDINNNEFRAWFGFDANTNSYKSNGQFSYSSAAVTLKYDPVPDKPYFVAHLDAAGLKPNFCYQLKLLGKPVHGDRGMTTQFSHVDLNGQKHAVGTSSINGDDWANEQIGFAGRWWDDDNAAPGTNLDDSFYLNNYKNKVAANPNDSSTHPIYGYLFMGSFVSQADGTAHVDLTGQSSYHIDWPSWQGGAPIEHFRSPYSVAAASDEYGYDYTPTPSMVRIYYETQRAFAGSDSGGDQRSVRVAMPAGTYHCRFLLTEESFHSIDAGGGYWKSVLVNEDFSRGTSGQLIPDSDASNDIVFTTPPSGLAAIASAGKVDLSWPASNGAASYNIKRRDTANGAFVVIQSGLTAQTATATFTDTNVIGGTTYTYAVVAVSSSEAIESANSNEANATPPVVNAAPVNLSLNPNRVSTPAKTERVLTATYSDNDGASDITLAALRIGGIGRNSANSLLCVYNAQTDKLSIYNDKASALIGSATPGSATVLTNSQGSLNCAGVTTHKSGNTLTINWNVSLSGAFAGSKQNVFLFVRDARSLSDGYDAFGTWTTTGNARPVNQSVSPPSASDSVGGERVFTASYFDANGWKNLSYVTLRLGGSGTGSTTNNDSAMVCVYNVQNGKLYLFNDAGAYVPQAAFPGTNVVLSNTQGSLDCARTTIMGSDKTLTLKWSVKAKAAFAGTRGIALFCRDKGGLSDGYDFFGTWTIGSSGGSSGATLANGLSQASAEASGITLIFMAPLDATSAANPANYTLRINSAQVEANVSVKSATVTLKPEIALRAGNQVEIAWHDLLDARGRTLQGRTTLSAR